jgi:hypothetical protein
MFKRWRNCRVQICRLGPDLISRQNRLFFIVIFPHFRFLIFECWGRCKSIRVMQWVNRVIDMDHLGISIIPTGTGPTVTKWGPEGLFGLGF